MKRSVIGLILLGTCGSFPGVALASPTSKLLLSTILMSSILQSTEATCYCPLEWVRNPKCREGIFFYDNGDAGNKWCWQTHYLARRPCDDLELKGECEHAKWEIEDWMSGKYRKRDKLLDAMVRANEITIQEMSAIDAAVTEVMEDLKINLGLNLECTEGLQTTHLNPKTHSHCFSEELVKKCKHAQTTTPQFFESVMDELIKHQALNPLISQKFIDLFQMQFTPGTNTIDIQCNVTTHVEFEANYAISKHDALELALLLILAQQVYDHFYF